MQLIITGIEYQILGLYDIMILLHQHVTLQDIR